MIIKGKVKKEREKELIKGRKIDVSMKSDENKNEICSEYVMVGELK